MSLVHRISGVEKYDFYTYRGPKGDDGAVQLSRVTPVAANYVILGTDDTILCDASESITLTLPVPVDHQMVIIKNISAFPVAVSGAAGVTIEGESSQTVYEGECLMLQYVALNYWVII